MGDRVKNIIKYNGDIIALAKSMGLSVDILNESYAIMDLSAEEQVFLSVQPQIEYIEEQKLLSLPYEPAISAPCITAEQRDNFGLTGRGVLIAILGSGIDYYHKGFINEDGTTRILCIWDQNIEGTPPAGFSIGNEFTRKEINDALNKTTVKNALSGDQIGQGTAAAGIASSNSRASDGSSLGIAPEASLLIIKLAQNTSPYLTSDTNVMRGIKYAFDVAAALDMPLVINMSYETNQGSHDGSSLFEQYINDMATRWKSSIVVPTGNEGASGKHFQGRVKTGDRIDTHFTVRRPLESLSISILKSFVDILELRIMDSEGRVIDFDLQRNHANTLVSEQVSISIVQPMPYNSDQSIQLIFHDLSGNTLMATKWTICIKGVSVLNGNINMWLPVTEISGASAFSSSESNTTLTIPSTVPNVISVGGYNSIKNTYANFSGRGFTMSNVAKPEICAPAVNIVSTAIGGGYCKSTGTSIAASISAGVCALMMQWGIVDGNDKTMYGQRLKAFLEYGADKNTALMKYPNPKWGYGALNLKNALDYAETFSNSNSSNISDNDNSLPAVELIQQESIETQLIDQPSQNLPNIISRNTLPEGENPATSESYVNYLITYDFATRRILSENPDILVSSIIQERYAIIHIPIEIDTEHIFELISGAERSRVFGLLANQALDAAGITAVKQNPNLDLTGRGVIVGVVDTGIDYNLDTFKYENNQSKILRIWDQSIESSDINNIPEGFIYGTEYTREQINQAISSDNPNIVPTRDEVGHGTFLASLAAGRGTALNEEGAAPDAELVVVKLRQAKQVVLNQDALFDPNINAYESIDIVNGVEYLINIARDEDRPIVIFFGMGTTDTAHSGLTYMEQYLSLVATISGVILVSAAGNEGDRAHHAAGKLSENEDMREIEFNVSSETTGFFMNLWAFTPDRLSVSLISPLGEIVERRKFIANESVSYSFILEKSQINIFYEYPDAQTGSQAILMRFITPQVGLWRLRVYGDLIIDGRFNIWLPLSSLWSNSAYFLQPDVNVTVTTPSTAPALISVGAYNSVGGSIYVSSSRGPNRLDELCPDFVAPGVNVIGVVPGGANGRMTGTSVAAAITAGACALLLQWAVVEDNFPAINNYRMGTFLFIGLTQRPEIIYPDNLWGYGELNLYNSFRNI